MHFFGEAHSHVQVLNSRYIRRLITMEKVAPYSEEAAAAWRQQLGDASLPVEAVPAAVYERRIGDNERVVKKKRFRGKST